MRNRRRILAELVADVPEVVAGERVVAVERDHPLVERQRFGLSTLPSYRVGQQVRGLRPCRARSQRLLQGALGAGIVAAEKLRAPKLELPLRVARLRGDGAQ